MKMNDRISIAALLLFLSCSDGGRADEECAEPPAPVYCQRYREPTVGWRCVEGACKRSVVSTCTRSSAENIADECITSLEVCKLLCNPFASLWPVPTGVLEIDRYLVVVDPGKVSFTANSPESKKLWVLLDDLQNYLVNAISAVIKDANNLSSGYGAHVTLETRSVETSLTLEMDESYELSANTVNNSLEIKIQANSYFGLRHGVETLSQLFLYDDASNSILAPAQVKITDAPQYPYRGFLLDTARSYYTTDSLKKLLDGMAMNKLNVFHWHITDSQSFPYLSQAYPDMAANGAYSIKQIYTRDDIEDIVEYGRARGVRVMPEIDTPSHVGAGWQYFDKIFNKSLVLCYNAKPWMKYCVEPPCGILDPTLDEVYDVLKTLYAEFDDLFDSDIFHMGGDEVQFQCWNSTPSVVAWMARNDMANLTSDDFIRLWLHFQERAAMKLDEVSNDDKQRRKIVLWTSTLTEYPDVERYLDPNRYIIQIWTKGDDAQIGTLFKKGYDLIFSNYDALYLDCGFGAWVGEGNNWCSPYVSWQRVYDNDPASLLTKQNVGMGGGGRILGAEAALWSEQSDTHTLETRVWPRSAAMAERLWSNVAGGWKQAESRFLHQRQRMSVRGVQGDLVASEWCRQNDDECNAAM